MEKDDKIKQDEIKKVLFNTYINKQTDLIIFEQYKLLVDSANKVTDRRNLANALFITVVGGLFAILGFVLLSKTEYHHKWIIPAIGIFISIFWYTLVHSYKQINTGKFEIICMIEKNCLPIAPYSAEWIALGKGENYKKYYPLTKIEKWLYVSSALIFLFIILYLLYYNI